MRPYEVMLILDSNVEEPVVQTTIDNAKTVVTERQGTFGQVDLWGRRRFAYELKHRWEGYYVLAEMSATPEAVAELDRTLGLSDDVIRHKISRLPDAIAGRRKPASTASESPSDSEVTGDTDE